MEQISFKVSNQIITRTDRFYVVADSRKYLSAQFNFTTPDWDDTGHSAIFTKGDKTYTVLLQDDRCVVPPECLSGPGKMLVSVFGTGADGKIITTDSAPVVVNESGYTEASSEPVTPGYFEQLMQAFEEAREQTGADANRAEAAVQSTETAAQAAKDAAEEAKNLIGEFEDVVNGAMQDIATAGTQQIDAIEVAGLNNVNAVNMTGEEQAEAVKFEGEKQIAAITDVSGDYITYDKAEALAIKKTSSGSRIFMQDSADWRLRGMRVHGRSTQESTTGAQLFDGGVSFDGMYVTPDSVLTKASANAGFYMRLSPGNYVYSQCYVNTDVQLSAFKDIPYEGAVASWRKPSTNQEMKFIFEITEEAPYLFVKYTHTGSESKPKEEILKTVMLNEGSTALPWEPYTGGVPSPNPDYPQEIISVGDNGSVEVSVGNNGYLMKGTYCLNVQMLPLKKGNTYYVTGGVVNGNPINIFVLNEFLEFKASPNLYDYSFGVLGLTEYIKNGDTIDGPARLISNTANGGYSFTVNADGLYLYQSINTVDKDTDDFYVSYTPDVPNQPYEFQSLILSTPDGLRGIPVPSGGNYTDETGQQWIADSVEFYPDGTGKRVQRVGEYTPSGNRKIILNDLENIDQFSIYIDVSSVNKPSNEFKNYGFCNSLLYKNSHIPNSATITNLVLYVRFSKGIYSVDDVRNMLPDITVVYVLETPIETPLTPEEVAQFKALHSYTPTTVIQSDAGAWIQADYVADLANYIASATADVREWIQKVNNILTGE